MTFGSLFAGIGGMDLGLERAGMTCKWQVEIDPFCRKVLAKHWPDVRRHDDVRTFPTDNPNDWQVDLICGGFPCQDISFAGKGAGLVGERSGLWYEFARVVRVLRPRYVLVENVAALLVRGLDAVLGTLAADGYDAEWACIPAAAVGAPHLRERVFLLAYPASGDDSGREVHPGNFLSTRVGRAAGPSVTGGPRSKALAHPSGLDGLGHGPEPGRPDLPGMGSCASDVPDTNGTRPPIPEPERQLHGPVAQCDWWAAEPDVGRVADGVPARVDRLRGLGNAVVPQVAEWIGRRIASSSLPVAGSDSQ
jgi:DNA (cytosine-5)-methyltransferase 1